jgi:hypothetical protein
MKIRHVTLVASVFAVAALAVGCETKDRSLGTNSDLMCNQVPQCQFQCPNGTINPTDSHGCVHTCECVTPTGGTGNSGGGGTGNTGGGGGGTGCDAIPQCDFLCPNGTRNPIDVNGCEHTCECKTHQELCPNEPSCGSQCAPGTVLATDRNGCLAASCTCIPAPSTTDGGSGGLRLYYTCGDPVCRGYTGGSGAPLCATEKVGDPCSVDGQKCDPQDDCNALVICAGSDPTMKPGGCPISRRQYKEDIHYLGPADLARYRDELLAMKLATWRYKHSPSKERLGFMIDDNEGSAAVDGKRDLVDLYGYTSMAVATIQLQAQQIDALKNEVAAMRKELARSSRANTNRKK